jgi:hypothetical protein
MEKKLNLNHLFVLLTLTVIQKLFQVEQFGAREIGNGSLLSLFRAG